MRKDIPGYEGLYYATSEGQIIGYRRVWVSGRYRNIQTIREEGPMRLFPNKWGYDMVSLTNAQGVQKHLTVHRLLAITFVPNPEEKAQVNHKDGNKKNNNVENLEWSTASENMQHAFDTGLHIPYNRPQGADDKKSKLTWDQVAEIRASNESQRILGKRYGVHHAIIAGIKKGTRYKTAVEQLEA